MNTARMARPQPMQRFAFALAIVICTSLSACTDRALSTAQMQNARSLGGIDYALPKGLVFVKLLKHKAVPNIYGLQFDNVSYVSDNDFQYTINYVSSAFSSDIVKITKKIDTSNNDAGLLEKVEFTSDEQSGQVLLKIVELGAEVAKVPFVPFATVGTVRAANEDDFDTVMYEGFFDPFSSSDLGRINEILNAFVEEGRIAIEIEIPGKGRGLDQVADVRECKWSICFRHPIAANLLLKSEGREFRRVSIVLPDKSVIGGIDIDRTALVNKEMTIEFESGMLKSVSVTKPSEALAGIQIPVNIVKTIVSIPGEILQLKIDTTKDSKALHEARLNELKAREELLEFKSQSVERDLPE